MYCKNCGTELPNDAKFCINCGDKINYQEKSTVIETPQNTGDPSNPKPLENSPIKTPIISKKNLGFYLGWVLLHLTLLLVFSSGAFDSKNSNGGIKDFWPLNGLTKYHYGEKFAYYYDISEFLVYTIFPLIFLVIIGLSKDNEKATETSLQENP